MIAAVRHHAEKHYNEDGWDYIVECYEDDEIEKEIGNASTNQEAIANVGRICKLCDDRRQDVIAEIF